jgi:hypothetical protein
MRGDLGSTIAVDTIRNLRQLLRPAPQGKHQFAPQAGDDGLHAERLGWTVSRACLSQGVRRFLANGGLSAAVSRVRIHAVIAATSHTPARTRVNR